MPKQTIRLRRLVPRARVTARGMLSTASAVVAGIMVAVVAAGGSYALWNDQVAISPITLTSGTVGLSITPAVGMDITELVPGASVTTTFTASNTGAANLSVAVTTTTVAAEVMALASQLSLELAPIDDPADCGPAIAEAATGALVGFTSTAKPVVIARGASQLYCLVATLSPSAPTEVQGETAEFTLNFDAQQVAP